MSSQEAAGSGWKRRRFPASQLCTNGSIQTPQNSVAFQKCSEIKVLSIPDLNYWAPSSPPCWYVALHRQCFIPAKSPPSFLLLLLLLLSIGSFSGVRMQNTGIFVNHWRKEQRAWSATPAALNLPALCSSSSWSVFWFPPILILIKSRFPF